MAAHVSVSVTLLVSLSIFGQTSAFFCLCIQFIMLFVQKHGQNNFAHKGEEEDVYLSHSREICKLEMTNCLYVHEK